MRALLVAGILALSGLPGSALAQEGDSFRDAARETELSYYGPVAVLFVTGAFGSPADSFSFYTYWDPPSPSDAPGRRQRYAVRKASRTSAEALWAASKDCPAVVEVLTAMEAIPSPAIDVPGIGEHPPLGGVVLDGVTFDLSVRWPAWTGQAMGYRLGMSSNLGTPLAEWAQTLDPALEACWTSTPPLPLRTGRSSL